MRTGTTLQYLLTDHLGSISGVLAANGTLVTGSEQRYMHEPGMDQFRAAWEESGYQLPFQWNHEADLRNGVPGSDGVFFQEHFVNPLAILLGQGSTSPSGTVDMVGGTIGSLDSISVMDAGNGNVLFVVENTTGWASGTRIPNTNISLIADIPREDSIFGGTIVQFFIWMEPHP